MNAIKTLILIFRPTNYNYNEIIIYRISFRVNDILLLQIIYTN